jgi:hypothetical protein|tara:strand:+ start:415 stop:783 length:369 start_codon:yes stop_codon:yes gene_type:complete
MATNAQWTVVFDDKLIIKQSGDGAGAYEIDNDSFWSESKWSNIWAVQYGTTNSSDEVEYRDSTSHTSWTDANLGSFQTQFIDKWDAAHLAKLQADWDADNVDGETEAEKITRLGARPTSYSS